MCGMTRLPSLIDLWRNKWECQSTNEPWAICSPGLLPLAAGICTTCFVPFDHVFFCRSSHVTIPKQCASPALWLMLLVTSNQNPDGWNNSKLLNPQEMWIEKVHGKILEYYQPWTNQIIYNHGLLTQGRQDTVRQCCSSQWSHIQAYVCSLVQYACIFDQQN